MGISPAETPFRRKRADRFGGRACDTASSAARGKQPARRYHLSDGGSGQSVAKTLAEVVECRPVLEPVLRAFEPLLAAQAQLADDLADSIRASGLELPEAQPGALEQGLSLLAGVPLTGAAAPLRQSAEKLLPLLATLETMAPHLPALEAFLLAPAGAAKKGKGAKTRQDPREALAEALLSGNSEEETRLAAAHDLDPSILHFAFSFVLAPVLRAIVSGSLPEEGDAPWDAGSLWRQGYCPVCGSFATIAWLDKPLVDEKNAYLAGGGGKKHLHCGLCGTDWKFMRGTCPSCGEKGSGVIEMLRESGSAHGERLDWCTKCKTYCPTVDLRERDGKPDMDALALGMMHLDMVAARKKLRPLKVSFWNTF